MPALTAARAAVSRKAFAGTRLQCACANGSATFMSSKALWLPGADSPRLNPSYLDGSLPGCEQRKKRGQACAKRADIVRIAARARQPVVGQLMLYLQ